MFLRSKSMFSLSNAELITDCLLSVEESDDDGNDEQEQDKKTRTTGRPVKKCETTTSKQNTKNVKKLPSQSNRARKGEKVLAKQQHVETPSSHKKK